MKEPRSSKASGAEPPERQHAAEQLAIAALGFIAGEPERLERFLALTGIAPESIRAAAREPEFLLGVLDHVAGDDALLLAFAQRRRDRARGGCRRPRCLGSRTARSALIARATIAVL